MNAVIETLGLTKHYRGGVRALDGVTVSLEEGRVHALLGRNGSGKTTLMQVLTGQLLPTAGGVRVFGADPLENAPVLARTCFIQESQRYPDAYTPRDVLDLARRLHPAWDVEVERRLVDAFRLPTDRLVKKLSRGQLSAIGIVVGLCSRAELTFFDEPYLGLDAVARARFYDELLEDVAAAPRTIVLSTHLVDEVAALVEHVVVLDEGRVLVDEDADELRGSAVRVAGREEAVARFTAGRDVLERDRLGGLASATVRAHVDDALRAELSGLGLESSPVSLQTLVVHLTQSPGLASAGR